MTRVMLVSNQHDVNAQPGYQHALAQFVTNGEISAYDIVPARATPASTAPRYIADRVCAFEPDVVLALSLKHYVAMEPDLRRALQGRPLVYWEGDAWGKSKPVPAQTAQWLRRSTVVFSVAGTPQAELLLDHGAPEVRMTLHTFDQVLFGHDERRVPDHLVAFAGNNLQRIPGLGGLPGSADRRLLVKRLRSTYRDDFLLAGRGWPRRYKVGETPYRQLSRFFGRARLVAAWEHYPDYEAYASDRLPIAMASGQVQVTSRPPGPALFGPDQGVHFASDPEDLLSRLEDLLALPEPRLREAGERARRWAQPRLSTEQALRHMLRPFVPALSPPDSDPWGRLPGPWIRTPTTGA
jgi:hypothetical protein